MKNTFARISTRWVARLIVLVMLFSLVSCNNSSDDPADETADTAAETLGGGTPTDGTVIFNGETEYTIVYSEDEEGAEWLATRVQETILAATGVKLKVRRDSKQYDNEISVGNADRQIAREAAQKLTAERDFCILSDGKSLALCVNSSAEYERMILTLADMLKKQYADGIWKLENACFLYSETPEKAASGNTLTLWQNGKTEYVLACDIADERAVACVDYLRSVFNKRLGVNIGKRNINTVKDQKIIYVGLESKNEAVTSVTDRLQKSDDHAICVVGDALVLTGSTHADLLAAVYRLETDFLASEKANIAEADNYVHSVVYPDSDFSEMIDAATFCALYQNIFETYSTWSEDDFEKWATTEQKADQALIEALIERMGDSFVFEIGHSSALYQKKIRKLDTTDYSRVAKLADNGDILIPAQFLRNYYSESVTADAEDYVNLTALCNADANLTLFYNASTKLVIVTPKDVASFADPTQSSGGYTNAQYTARMTEFFHSELMPEPQNNTEQSRVVIEYVEYPENVLDYTTNYYFTTYSPGIAMVKDGDQTILYASYEISEVCNISDERSTTTVIKKSTDYGKTWEKVGEVKDVRWASIFNRGKEIYLIGNSLANGAAVIAKLDEGKTSNFVQIATGTGGTAPTAVLEHDGRIYKAYSNHILSAPADANLLDPAVWTKSQSVQGVLTSQKIGEITGRPNATAMPIEPNVVAGEDGKLYVFYRIDRATQMQIVLELSKDGKTFSLVEDINSIIKDFPTSKSKITIRYDESTGKYFTISSLYMGGRMQNQRIVLALAVSDDLFNWEVVDYLLVSREMANPEWEMYAHGFQYADFVIDGDNILMVVREAIGYTNCYHDGNYTTFYIIENYKTLL